MRLVYEDNGEEVRVGDTPATFRGEVVLVKSIEKPHKPSSTGKVYTDKGDFYPSVIGAEWVDREDQE